MQDAVGDEDVWLDNLGSVDVLVVARLADGDLAAVEQRVEGAGVGQHAEAEHLAGHDVVLCDVGQRRRVEVLQRAAHEVHGRFLGSKDCHAGADSRGGHDAAGVQRADEAVDVEGVAGLENIGRLHQEVVDNLHEAALEGDVAVGHGAAAAEARRQDGRAVVVDADEHVLAARDVGVLGVGQERRLHVRRAGRQAGRVDAAAQDVVAQDGQRGFVVGRVPDAVERRVRDVGKGGVRGSNDLGKVSGCLGRKQTEERKKKRTHGDAIGAGQLEQQLRVFLLLLARKVSHDTARTRTGPRTHLDEVVKLGQVGRLAQDVAQPRRTVGQGSRGRAEQAQQAEGSHLEVRFGCDVGRSRSRFRSGAGRVSTNAALFKLAASASFCAHPSQCRRTCTADTTNAAVLPPDRSHSQGQGQASVFSGRCKRLL